MAGKNDNKSKSKPKPKKKPVVKKKSKTENKFEEFKKAIYLPLPQNEQNHIWSVVLFALGILLGLMVLVPGTAGWNAIHKLLLGLFGGAVFFVPVIIVYTSVLIGLDKSTENISGRAKWGIALTFLASAFIQIFFVGELPGENFSEHLTLMFEQGSQLKGGGLGSMLIAGPLLIVFGSIGAKIITVLLFFVFAMLLTGQGLIQFFEKISKPFRSLWEKTGDFRNFIFEGEYYDSEGEYTEEQEEKEKESFQEDLEAIDFINARDKAEPLSDKNPVIKVKSRKTQENKVKSIPDDEGFLMDVPLPDENAVSSDKISDSDEPVIHIAETVSKKKEKNVKTKNSIDELIEKAEENKKRKDEDIDLNFKRKSESGNPNYKIPSVELLALPDNETNSLEARTEMNEKAKKIVETFASFGVEVSIKEIFRGPSITRYEIQPGTGVKVSKIRNLEDDIALSLAAQGVRIEAPVPGKAAVGIEVPNINKDLVTLREILSSSAFRNSSSKLSFAVGKDITGNAIVGDITKMPHVIIAGTTGSGKSVCTRSIIMSILYNATPKEVKMILIDPKMVEFKVFEGIPHLLIPIVTDPKKAAGALNWAVNEMMRRYQKFADIGANDIKSYNEITEIDGETEKMSQIVIFIDELADMMLVAGKEVEDSICRLAQMGRAAGMHLVVATQRPTTDVITGLIKANIPSRIALSVMSQVDSRTIIDMAGADKLLGNGDMLYMPIGMNKPVRIQGCFASSKDINSTLDFIRKQCETEYDNDIINAVDNFVPQTKGGHDTSDGMPFEAGSDEDYIEKAIEVAVSLGQISTSMLQRKLKLGYARAARIMDELEEMGVVGASEGAKPRKVLMSQLQYEERRLRLKD